MPYGRCDRLQQAVLLDLLVAERLDADLGARRIEDPDHDLLAEQRRQGADPEVDRLVAELELHPAVLRHAPLGDVEPGDDLDARRQLVLDRERRLGDLAQLAVDAEADAVVVLVGLEVQVGRAQVDRVDQHLLQEADDRRVLDVARVLRLGGLAA